MAQNSDTKNASYSQYRFDDENRLFQIIVRRVSDNVVLTQTTFFYDGMGRKKWILEQDVVSGSYLNKRETFFAHDGMDVVRERENVYGTAGQTSTITTTVQQLTRTGNIGGILARTKQVNGQADRHSFYSYDGSGNVISITDSSQNVQCAYAYSGFGLEKTQEAVGWEQPYRYSTKWQHGSSGLIDYGFRFYNPAWGRWINRDPIAESGGVNIYAMVSNNPSNLKDEYGMASSACGLSDDPEAGLFYRPTVNTLMEYADRMENQFMTGGHGDYGGAFSHCVFHCALKRTRQKFAGATLGELSSRLAVLLHNVVFEYGPYADTTSEGDITANFAGHDAADGCGTCVEDCLKIYPPILRKSQKNRKK